MKGVRWGSLSLTSTLRIHALFTLGWRASEPHRRAPHRRVNSVNVFLNFATLGAATARQ